MKVRVNEQGQFEFTEVSTQEAKTLTQGLAAVAGAYHFSEDRRGVAHLYEVRREFGGTADGLLTKILEARNAAGSRVDQPVKPFSDYERYKVA